MVFKTQKPYPLKMFKYRFHQIAQKENNSKQKKHHILYDVPLYCIFLLFNSSLKISVALNQILLPLEFPSYIRKRHILLLTNHMKKS